MGLFDVFRRKKPIYAEPEPPLVSKPKQVEPPPSAAPFIPTPRFFPARYNGRIFKYRYNHVDVYTPSTYYVRFGYGDLGKDVRLVREPDNPRDSRAIAVYVRDTKIGYLNRGKLQDMANDYITMRGEILGCIDSVDDTSNRCTIALYFYAPPEVLGVYQLTNSGSKSAQDAAEMLGSNCPVDVSLDEQIDRYEVCTTYGARVGYLPKTANAVAAEEPDFFVDHLDLSENDKLIIFVRAEK